tara:strand:+ start:1224 stop:1427 length:204 start_codon:yes stop_codon:yes gene_type:complete
MNDLIENLITEFKKQKVIRGNLYDNFMFYSYEVLGANKNDKYKGTRASILHYMTQNKNEILLRLTRD